MLMILLKAHLTPAAAIIFEQRKSKIKSASETRQHYFYDTLSQKCNTQHTVSF